MTKCQLPPTAAQFSYCVHSRSLMLLLFDGDNEDRTGCSPAFTSLHLSHRLPPETCHHQRTNDIIAVVFIIICPKLPDSFITFLSYAAACSCYSTGAHKQTHAYTQAHTERKETPAQPDTAWTWEVTLSVSRDVSRTSPRSLTHRPQCLYLVRAD